MLITEAAKRIDTRTTHEYLHDRLGDCLNIPLDSQREQLDQPDINHIDVMLCDTASHCASVCYPLNERGFVACLPAQVLNQAPCGAIIHPDKY